MIAGINLTTHLQPLQWQTGLQSQREIFAGLSWHACGASYFFSKRE